MRFGLDDEQPRTLEGGGQGVRGHPRAHPPDRVEDARQAAPSPPLAEAARVPRGRLTPLGVSAVTPRRDDGGVGYRGKLAEQERARALRAQAWTLNEIAAELGVSKSSVSLWVRGSGSMRRPVRPGRAPTATGASDSGPERRRLSAGLRRSSVCRRGRRRIGALSGRDLLIAGTALYAGEGTKTDGAVAFANSDPRMVILFCRWLRQFFVIDEARLRVYLYLHVGLDLDAAVRSGRRPPAFPCRSSASRTARSPIRASGARSTDGVPAGLRTRAVRPIAGIMGLVEALLSSDVPSGVAQLAAAADC